MSGASQPDRSRAGCLSDLVLDRIAAGDASPHAHLAACDLCSARLAELTNAGAHAGPVVERLLERARRQVQATPPRPRLPSLLSPRKLALASAAAVVCAGILLTVAGPEPHTPEPGGVRMKGNNLRFFVQRDGRVVPGRSKEAYRTGDALRFVVSNPEAVFFLLVGVDELGRINVYYPYQGSHSVRLPPGTDQPLPGSLVLDDSRQTEFYIGIFTPAPVTLDEVTAAVEAARVSGTPIESALRSMRLGQQHLVVIRRK